MTDTPIFQNLPIKETESLIALLCILMYVEADEQERLNIKTQICNELERRGTIASAQTLIKYIK